LAGKGGKKKGGRGPLTLLCRDREREKAKGERGKGKGKKDHGVFAEKNRGILPLLN